MAERGRLPRRAARDADRIEPARGPQRGAAVEAERAEGVRLGEALDGEAREAGDRGELLDAGVAVAAGGDELLDLVLVEALDLAEAETHGAGVGFASPLWGGVRGGGRAV